MSQTRILIVDDQVTLRHLLREAMKEFINLEIAGSVSNGKLALSKIPQVNPDIIFLDVDMPEENGLQTLLKIRKTYPDLPVLMLAHRKEPRQAAMVLEAMAAGANGYIFKPKNSSPSAGQQEGLRREILAKIKSFSPELQLTPARLESKTKPLSQVGNAAPPTQISHHPRVDGTVKKPRRVDILAIGVSTGGPQALAKILPSFSKDFPVPIVIVQHMPVNFTDLLAKRLHAKSSINVAEARDGDILEPGGAWLAPGDRHMIVKRVTDKICIHTHRGPPENSCRPAVDVLFHSVAQTFGGGTLAVVLTGMGRDGLRGCEKIHATGGKIWVQDEDSSVVWGMPGYVHRAGLAEEIYSLETFAANITHRVWQGQSRPSYQTGMDISA